MTALYQAHALGLIRLAVIMLDDRPTAEDVVQDAFAGLYRRWHALSDTGKALSYVRSSVLNGARSALRQRARQPASPGDPAAESADPATESAETAALLSEEHREVLAAIRRLPDRQREALVLRYYLELDEEDIAQSMGISRGTVKSTTSRAIAALRKTLGDPGMRTIEDRIRAATRAAGETVPPDSVPPLRLPPQMLNGRSHGRSPYWTRWSRRLAPAAAAAAVIAVALTVTIVRLLAHGGETSGSKGSPASEVPRYYVAIAANGNPASVPAHAVVRETMSGALLATIMPSVAGDAIFAVTAAADDQTFVLDEQKWVPRTSGDNQASQTRLFYLLRLSSSGRPSSLTRLPITAGRLVTGVALSPDGTRLAIAVQPDTGPANVTEVRIYTLATGAVRTWSGIGTIGTGEDDAVSISWTADARTLAFDWYPDKQSDAGVRLLDVTRAGSDLLASSRRVVPLVVPPPSGLTCQTDAVITADGSTVVCGAIRYPPRFGQDSTAGFLEYSTATGKLVRTIHSQRSKAPIIGLMWSNPSGSVLIGAVAGGRSGTGQVGIITGSTFTPLPVPGALNPALAGVW